MGLERERESLEVKDLERDKERLGDQGFRDRKRQLLNIRGLERERETVGQGLGIYLLVIEQDIRGLGFEE